MPPLIKRLARWIGATAAASVLAIAIAVAAFDVADRAFPPPLDAADGFSPEVVDRDGALLRAFATPSGHWRLKADLDKIDPQFLRMLVSYEDQRFWTHHGIDPAALLRALGQLASHGRIVSGASTLSMQLARLLEPRERTFGAKFVQMFRALQIERRLTKHEILERYLTLAPYGGNIEGVRAASLAWFGKEPRQLSIAESALLVALPQLPEKRRPDRNLANAGNARARVLQRMVEAGAIEPGEVDRAMENPVPAARLALPAYAPHLAEAALRANPTAPRRQLKLKRSVQAGLEAAARDAALRLGPKVSVAIVMADARTGDIVGSVGAADYFNGARAGGIDMTDIVRSPGSTLKPFIYGIAFEDGLIAQETVIEDRPADFAGYRPKNFDMAYEGDVSVRQALQMSLNIPAVRLLDAVGPTRLMARMRRAGVSPRLPGGDVPGLAIALGGAGVTLRDLVQLYTALARGGEAVALNDGLNPPPGEPAGGRALDPMASWQVTDILSGMAPPQGARQAGIAYKTGTSYGYRDAWSIGYDGRHVLGVWVGRPDGGSVPGLTGYLAAAPILFDGWTRSGVGHVPFARAPTGAMRLAAADLPLALRRFASAREAVKPVGATEAAPDFVYPPQGATVDLGVAAGSPMPLMLKLNGGRAPFRWLANGRALPERTRTRTNSWNPDGAGYATLTVIDAVGRAASVKVFVQ